MLHIADWLYTTDLIDEPTMIAIFECADAITTIFDSARCLLQGWCSF